ncbi:MAG: metal-dependent transcriptional regulator [Planctomycetota bacterium]|nr:metal-dependent transcriptional regulator [Planctomycetota bacterium]MDA1247966.1 metal-dependent transcriptional regulator [Planctomycetota bacterium]
MLSLTVENYLKAILQLELRDGTPSVATGQLATRLGVSPGSVTSMLKTLSDSGLADYRPYEGVTLNESGRLLALRMLRRHRLIEQFLVETLNLSWDQVHEEAENMEHAVSDVLIDRIDEYLGHPEVDPHGDPIPAADGRLRGSKPSSSPLSSCDTGRRVRVSRVMNQHPDFLRYLSEEGLEVGTVATVTSNSREAGIIELTMDERRISIGSQAATDLLVVPVEAGPVEAARAGTGAQS